MNKCLSFSSGISIRYGLWINSTPYQFSYIVTLNLSFLHLENKKLASKNFTNFKWNYICGFVFNCMCSCIYVYKSYCLLNCEDLKIFPLTFSIFNNLFLNFFCNLNITLLSFLVVLRANFDIFWMMILKRASLPSQLIFTLI